MSRGPAAPAAPVRTRRAARLILLAPLLAGYVAAGPASAVSPSPVGSSAPPSPAPSSPVSSSPTPSAPAATGPASTPSTPASSPTSSAPALGSPASGSPGPTDGSGATAQFPVVVRLTGVRPLVPQPGDVLTVTGTLRNSAPVPVAALSVELRLSAPLITRGAFDDYAAEPDQPLTGLFPVGQPALLRAATLAPGAIERFSVSLPVDDLGLPATAWQVRELGVSVQGTASAGYTQLGQVRTFLPWAPRGAAFRGRLLRLGWLWPLVDVPHRGPGSAWLDDGLAPSLHDGGRLAGLLAAGAAAADQAVPSTRHRAGVRAVPVTWALDPMLVEDAAAMAGGYTVAGSGSGSRGQPGAGTADARGWLSHLRSALSGADVIALPYADPDVTAAARAGLSAEIGVAVATGRAVLTRLLPGVTARAVGWLPDGEGDQRAVDALFGAGLSSVVLADSALPVVGGDSSATPSAPATVVTDTGSVSALLSDSRLSAAVDAGAEQPDDAAAQRQRFVAETLMIQVETPSIQRSVVVAPPRRWAPSPAYAAQLLRDTGRLPWLRPTSLAQMGEASATRAAVTRGPLTYPPAARRAELPAGYLRSVRSLLGQIADFGAILPAASTDVRSFALAAQRTLSSGLRLSADQERVLDADRAALDSAMTGVRIASHPGSFVTLTSHRGAVPITIANNLGSDVRVVLQVEANQRVTLGGGGRVSRTIPAHQQVAVDVQAAAKTSGVFPLRVRLLTPAGHPYGPVVQLNVRSTFYGTVTIVITGAATAALLVAVAVRLARRGLRARRRGRAAVTTA